MQNLEITYVLGIIKLVKVSTNNQIPVKDQCSGFYVNQFASFSIIWHHLD